MVLIIHRIPYVVMWYMDGKYCCTSWYTDIGTLWYVVHELIVMVYGTG